MRCHCRIQRQKVKERTAFREWELRMSVRAQMRRKTLRELHSQSWGVMTVRPIYIMETVLATWPEAGYEIALGKSINQTRLFHGTLWNNPKSVSHFAQSTDLLSGTQGRILTLFEMLNAKDVRATPTPRSCWSCKQWPRSPESARQAPVWVK